MGFDRPFGAEPTDRGSRDKDQITDWKAPRSPELDESEPLSLKDIASTLQEKRVNGLSQPF